MDGRKLIAAVVLVPLALYGGGTAYVHYKVGRQFDELKTTAAPYVTLQRGAIGVTLWNGKVAIADISIQPTGFSDVVRIEELTVEAGGPLALFGLSDRLAGSKAPDSASFAVRGLAFDLGGQLARTADKFVAQAAGTTRPMDHCGGMTFVGFAQYRKLGYEHLVTDFSTAYETDRRTGNLRVRIDGLTRDMGSFHVETEMANAAAGGSAPGGGPGRLVSMRGSYRDTSYVERFKRYCMQASGLGEPEFIEAEVAHLSDTLYDKWGTGLGPGLRDAYREFLTKPGEVRVEARPRDNFDANMLALLGPPDLVQLLDMTLSVNNDAVADLSFDVNARPAPRKAVADSAVGDEPAPGPTAAIAAAPARAERDTGDGFRPVRVAELSQYLGRDVRVQAVGAAAREGILAEVQPAAIVIERRYAGGAMTVRVPVAQIRQVEVRF